MSLVFVLYNPGKPQACHVPALVSQEAGVIALLDNNTLMNDSIGCIRDNRLKMVFFCI